MEAVKTENTVAPKTKQELTQEYTNVCAVMGDKVFRSKLLQAEIDSDQMRMHALISELTKIANEEKAAALKVAATSTEV